MEDEIQNRIANVEESLKNELNTIINLKDTTYNNKSYLMDILEKLSGGFTSDNIIEESHLLPQLFKSLNDALAKSDSNLLILKNLENTLNSILFSISMQCSNNTINIDSLEQQINLYNAKKMESKTDILNNSTYINKFISSSKAIVNEITNTPKSAREEIIKEFKENRDNTNVKKEQIAAPSVDSVSENVLHNEVPDTNPNDVLYKPYKINENDTLLISEKQEKVFLPYTLEDLNNLMTNPEKSIDDIVRENFVISIHKFKNPTISRFKEAYNLARNKSGYSVFKSFNIAVDAMFKYSLNPAIIVACKSVDELKDYLKCLKEQKLDLFKAFKIKYEINPMKI